MSASGSGVYYWPKIDRTCCYQTIPCLRLAIECTTCRPSMNFGKENQHPKITDTAVYFQNRRCHLVVTTACEHKCHWLNRKEIPTCCYRTIRRFRSAMDCLPAFHESERAFSEGSIPNMPSDFHLSPVVTTLSQRQGDSNLTSVPILNVQLWTLAELHISPVMPPPFPSRTPQQPNFTQAFLLVCTQIHTFISSAPSPWSNCLSVQLTWTPQNVYVSCFYSSTSDVAEALVTQSDYDLLDSSCRQFHRWEHKHFPRGGYSSRQFAHNYSLSRNRDLLRFWNVHREAVRRPRYLFPSRLSRQSSLIHRHGDDLH